MSSKNNSNKTQIIVALIGLIGVLGGAFIANVDTIIVSLRDKEREKPHKVVRSSVRSVPQAVSESEFKRVFGLDENFRPYPSVYINNN